MIVPNKPPPLPGATGLTYSPLSIFATITSGKLVIPTESMQVPTEVIKNPNGGAMLLDSICFIGGSLSGKSGPASQPFNGAYMSVQMFLGRNALTNGYVPICLFAETMSILDEQISAQAGTSPGFTPFVWHLPKPLYLPKAEALDIRIRVGDPSDAADSAKTRFHIVLRGRSLEKDAPVPQEIYLPWVAPWLGLARAAASGPPAVPEKSPESALSNPHKETVFIQRMLYRAFSAGSFGAGPTTQIKDNSFNADAYPVTIQMVDHMGQVLLRDPTSPAIVFAVDGSWDMRSVMPPKSYYKLTLNELGWSAVQPVQPFQPAFSIVGHRKCLFSSLGLRSIG